MTYFKEVLKLKNSPGKVIKSQKPTVPTYFEEVTKLNQE